MTVAAYEFTATTTVTLPVLQRDLDHVSYIPYVPVDSHTPRSFQDAVSPTFGYSRYTYQSEIFRLATAFVQPSRPRRSLPGTCTRNYGALCRPYAASRFYGLLLAVRFRGGTNAASLKRHVRKLKDSKGAPIVSNYRKLPLELLQ